MPSCSFVILFLTFFATTECEYSGRAGTPPLDQELLLHYIFNHKQYDTLSRPVLSESDSITIFLELAIIQIVQVDEKSQRLKSNVWIRMIWNDYRLAWKPSDFGGMPQINIPSDKIWKPDIVLLNNVDGQFEASWQPNTVVFSNGSVLWIPAAIFKSSCQIDVRFFPFDQQTCHIILGSWTYNSDQVHLQFNKNRTSVDLSNYVTSGSWILVNGPADLTVDPAPVYPDFKDKISSRWGKMGHRQLSSQMTFHIILRRMPLFYITNLVIPCVLIGLLSACVFYLPTEAGEKITLSISILVTLVVYMLLVSKLLPPGPKTIPLLSQFLLFTFALNFLTLCITMLIINLNHRNPKTHPMPDWVRTVFIDTLPRMLCLHKPVDFQKELTVTIELPLESDDSNSSEESDGHEEELEATTEPTFEDDVTDLNRDCSSSKKDASRQKACVCRHLRNQTPIVYQNRWSQSTQQNGAYGDNTYTGAEDDYSNGKNTCNRRTLTHRIDRNLRNTMKSVEFITKHVMIERNEEQIHEDWKYVAAVVDRITLFIFIVGTISGTLGILLNAPYINQHVDQKSVIKLLSYH